MCVYFFAVNVNPRFPVMIAGNRDEFLDRGSKPAHFWPEHPAMLAGRDEKDGGTWGGVSRAGAWAFLTNFRDPKAVMPDRPSRGGLAADFLTGGKAPCQWLEKVGREGHLYNPFNVAAGLGAEIYWFSSRMGVVEKLPDGVHGLSNAFLDTPWPKVARGVSKMREIAGEIYTPDDAGLLFDMLGDTETAPDGDLPDTGVGLDFERVLSSIFVTSPVYGTRCSTILLIGNDGTVSFCERTYKNCDPGDFTGAAFGFRLPSGEGQLRPWELK